MIVNEGIGDEQMIAILTAGMSALVRTLGEDGTYTVKVGGATHALRAIIERDIAAPVNDMSRRISERRTVLKITSAALTAASITPAIGDTFTVGSEIWTVLAIDQDDGYLTRLRVRK
jgi:hypothetical protein